MKKNSVIKSIPGGGISSLFGLGGLVAFYVTTIEVDATAKRTGFVQI